MKLRPRGMILLMVFLGLLGAAGLRWHLSRQGIAIEDCGAAPSNRNKLARAPERPKAGHHANEKRGSEEPSKRKPREIVPQLKRQPRREGEDWPVPPDIDRFGDITQELYHVRWETLKRLIQAQEAGKPSAEIAEFEHEVAREAQEYIRRHFPEASRLLSEGKVAEAMEVRNKKVGHGGGYALLSSVMAMRQRLIPPSNFRFGGLVVDERGEPLSDVEVNIMTSGRYRDGTRLRAADFSGKVKVSGPFAFRVDDAFWVKLEFRKPGYYPVREHMSSPQPSRDRLFEVGLTGKQFPPEVIERRNLRIVMEKQGELTRLRSGGGTLTFRRDGTGDVLTMGVNADGHWFMRTTSGQDMSIAPPRGLPEKCVYVVPKTNNEGSITLLRFSALESRRAIEVSSGTKPEVAVLRVPDDESQYVYAPAGLRLVVSDPQGGFVRYETKPDREIRPDRPWSRDMKEAPEAEYLQELVLDSDAIKKLFANPDEPQPVYFYIKAFGKYGKGRLDLKIMLKEAHRKYVNGQLEPIRYLLDEAALAAQVHILMQPDGSRNLKGYE